MSSLKSKKSAVEIRKLRERGYPFFSNKVSELPRAILKSLMTAPYEDLLTHKEDARTGVSLWGNSSVEVLISTRLSNIAIKGRYTVCVDSANEEVVYFAKSKFVRRLEILEAHACVAVIQKP